MVGEIRDRETADIAVQAALTGHLVLSTVHTNDAVGAITRLRDMKVEPFLIASTVRAVLAQRLVRRLCPECREPVAARRSRSPRCSASTPGTIVYEPQRLRRPAAEPAIRAGSACSRRSGSTTTIRRLINAGGDEAAIAAHAFRVAATRSTAAARRAGPRRRDQPGGGGAGVAPRGGRCLISPMSGSTRPGASGAARCAPRRARRRAASSPRASSTSCGSSPRPRARRRPCCRAACSRGASWARSSSPCSPASSRP